VSHRLREIFALADRVTVLRDGACIGTRPIAEVTEAALISMMVGRSIDQLFPRSTRRAAGLCSSSGTCPIGAPSSTCPDRSGRRDPGHRWSRRIRKDRAGPHHLRITPATSGEILVDGKPVVIDGPRVARDLGIAYIPEDRGLQGLIRAQSLRENVRFPSSTASPGPPSSTAAARRGARARRSIASGSERAGRSRSRASLGRDQQR